MCSDNRTDPSIATFEENLKKATTEMLLLHLLSRKPCYIGELTEQLRSTSGEILQIVFPYAAIYRLLQAGHIAETQKLIAPDGRRRQYYAITQTGLGHLQHLLATYTKFSKGVANLLQEGEDPN